MERSSGGAVERSSGGALCRGGAVEEEVKGQGHMTKSIIVIITFCTQATWITFLTFLV